MVSLFYFGRRWVQYGACISLLDRNRILQHQMQYTQARETYTSNHRPSWFQGEGIEGYKAPLTVSSSDFANIHSIGQKQNLDDLNNQKKQSNSKGYSFDKAPKLDIFPEKKSYLPPDYYFKTTTETSENQSKVKMHESSFFMKYPRFQQRHSYFEIPQVKKNQMPKNKTLSTAEVIRFIDYAGLKGTWTPGPGAYDLKENRHKSLSNFSKSNKKSFPEINETSKKDKKKGLGPQTYLISRSLSLACSVKLKQPLRQSDNRIKEGIARVNVSKQKASKAGPGKYLKIEDWCKYKNNRKINNGLDVCSKPANQLKIYT